MKPNSVRLIRIDNNRNITPESDPEFYTILEEGLLMALSAQALITEEQLEAAVRYLRRRKNRE